MRAVNVKLGETRPFICFGWSLRSRRVNHLQRAPHPVVVRTAPDVTVVSEPSHLVGDKLYRGHLPGDNLPRVNSEPPDGKAVHHVVARDPQSNGVASVHDDVLRIPSSPLGSAGHQLDDPRLAMSYRQIEILVEENAGRESSDDDQQSAKG